MNVRNEIGHQVDEVDKVAQVLLKAALRATYLQEVELLHAGFVQVAVPAIVLGPLLLLGCGLAGQHFVELNDSVHPTFSKVWLSIQSSSILARLAFLWLFCRRSSIHERCFMLNAMAKIVTVFCFCLVELSSVFSARQNIAVIVVYSFYFAVFPIFAVLGIRGTLKLQASLRAFRGFLPVHRGFVRFFRI